MAVASQLLLFLLIAYRAPLLLLRHVHVQQLLLLLLLLYIDDMFLVVPD